MKPIWFKPYQLSDIENLRANTLVETLAIDVTEIGPDYLVGRMPVNSRVHQMFGVLHGGASLALAETLGSVAANMVIDDKRQYGVGLEINANHLRSVSSGFVTGTTKPFHIGGTTQVWSIEIRGDDGKPVCISRLTIAIRDRKS
jgi:1,4-dihydroxy-2-naphthoyl-CoA hydrolase